MEYQMDKTYGRTDVTSINCRSLFLFVIFFTILNLAQNAALPPDPPIILVFSVTKSNPLHMILGDSPHVTTDITEGKLK